jgi:hypothetical protein
LPKGDDVADVAAPVPPNTAVPVSRSRLCGGVGTVRLRAPLLAVEVALPVVDVGPQLAARDPVVALVLAVPTAATELPAPVDAALLLVLAPLLVPVVPVLPLLVPAALPVPVDVPPLLVLALLASAAEVAAVPAALALPLLVPAALFDAWHAARPSDTITAGTTAR